jgi:hypothetical protein
MKYVAVRIPDEIEAEIRKAAREAAGKTTLKGRGNKSLLMRQIFQAWFDGRQAPKRQSADRE